MKRIVGITAMYFVYTLSQAQNLSFKIQNNVRLPKDSVELKKVFNAFDEFLIGLNTSNESTPHVPDSLKAETFVLIDEIRNCGRNEQQKIDNYYSPSVINIVQLNPHQYILQFQYAAAKENNFELRAIFEVLVKVTIEEVLIYSPLKFLTRNFLIEDKNNIKFVYAKFINTKETGLYRKYTGAFDKKLDIVGVQTDVYCFDNLVEMERACGVLFKSDYNGIRGSEWTANAGNRHIALFANRNAEFNSFDPHDLFHERISIVKARKLLYRPADEGCAYLYGGSWGFSWKQILAEFIKMQNEDMQMDWVEVKEKPMYFKTGEFKNQADYIVNALIIEKLEKEKGFSAVWELLNCGPAQAGHENFYALLQRLWGVEKKDYNAFVEKLIADAK